MLDTLSATKTALGYEDFQMSQLQLDEDIQSALGFLDELLFLCLREGRRAEGQFRGDRAAVRPRQVSSKQRCTSRVFA